MNNSIDLNKDYEEIMNFWFSPEVQPKWFIKDSLFDSQIKNKFEELYQNACNGLLDSWLETPKGSLALIILLDQFPRNMYRNTLKAFASDSLALKYAKLAINKEFDKEIRPEKAAFIYIPFMHSELLEDQLRAVELFSQPGFEHSLSYAIEHKNIIEKFGRFPHRNKILNRRSTAKEEEFLKTHPGF